MRRWLELKDCKLDVNWWVISIMLFVCHPKVVFNFSRELKWPQEKLKIMLMQNFGVTKKEHYGMFMVFSGVVN